MAERVREFLDSEQRSCTMCGGFVPHELVRTRPRKRHPFARERDREIRHYWECTACHSRLPTSPGTTRKAS